MSGYLDTLKSNIARSVIAAMLILPAGAAMAQPNPSSQQIIDALKPKRPLTRSLSVSPAEQAKKAETDKFVDTLRNRPTRSGVHFDQKSASAAPWADHCQSGVQTAATTMIAARPRAASPRRRASSGACAASNNPDDS